MIVTHTSRRSGDDEIDDVTLPLMTALERLSPVERAGFLAHDVFGVGFEEDDWLIGPVDKQLGEELGKLQVEINDEKSRTVDLERGECFGLSIESELVTCRQHSPTDHTRSKSSYLGHERPPDYLQGNRRLAGFAACSRPGSKGAGLDR